MSDRQLTFGRVLAYLIAIVGVAIGSLVAGMVSGVVRNIMVRLLGPRFNSIAIRQWLGQEPYYLSQFEAIEDTDLSYEFEVSASQSERSLRIQPIGSFVRIVGELEFDPGILAILDEGPKARRNLETQIEAALVTSNVVYSFKDKAGNFASFPEADGVVVEYRIYRNDLERKELLNGIVAVDDTLDYIESRANSVGDEFDSNR